MSGFSIAWLDLREAADLAARDTELARMAITYLQNGNPTATTVLITDLGSGTGSTLRAFSALGASSAVWRLIDLDGALLDEALRRHSRDCVIEDYPFDLSKVEELPLHGSRLITASALFDLVSREFVAQLIPRLHALNAGLYAALNYDGTTSWEPPHPLDTVILEAFNADQRRDKGMGPALGPDATAHIRDTLQACGYTVYTAASPWRLNGESAALVRELILGIAAAVALDHGLNDADIQRWKEFRLAHISTGQCFVGHRDLLALPATGI
jgi:hypothetical protein